MVKILLCSRTQKPTFGTGPEACEKYPAGLATGKGKKEERAASRTALQLRVMVHAKLLSLHQSLLFSVSEIFLEGNPKGPLYK